MSAATDSRLTALYPCLAGLPSAALAELPPPMTVPAGTVLFSECQPCQGFPLVLDGTVKVVRSAASGRELMLYQVVPGASCLITSSCLLGRSPYPARGETLTPVTLTLLPRPLFDRLLAEHAPFREFVFHLFADRLADLMTLVEEVAFQRLDQRLARLLLARGGLTADGRIAATHQQLAEELGSVREIVSRLLKQLADAGAVRLSRGGIDLLDRDILSRFAAPA
ncbi:Crp/Fnr family transcriptional regulator [Oryzomicrobium sp.]|uniref:Crp/Fnr family transcriptional regulator n=1 Tax=Oryzomicrobium sp. TaxID=1911578 RepID=UPI0025EFD160|nr:Crp/Fnr family transcriptional regulator [Oryzomicrobium sp.]MCE1244754.1 Crp/Fnr family transcriptional regulator [Oryzomicrobium sp.]